MENTMNSVCTSCGNTNLTYKDTVEISFEIPYRRRDVKSCIICKNCVKNIERILNFKVYSLSSGDKKESHEISQHTKVDENNTSQRIKPASNITKNSISRTENTQDSAKSTKTQNETSNNKPNTRPHRVNTAFNSYIPPSRPKKEVDEGPKAPLNRHYVATPEIHRVKKNYKQAHIDKLVHEHNEERHHDLQNRSYDFENKMKDINDKLLAKEQKEKEKELQERIERERQERIKRQEYRKSIESKLESFEVEEKKGNTRDEAKLKLIDSILNLGVANVLTKYCNRDYPLRQLAKELESSEYLIRELMRYLGVERYNHSINEQQIVEIENKLNKRDINSLGRGLKEKRETSKELTKDKFDIDKARLSDKVVSLLEVSEEKIKDTCNKCTRCAYYEKEVGWCWYTMTTGKQRKTVGNRGCAHYVDLESVKDIIASKGKL